MSKPRENKNGAGNPRNDRSARNFRKNEVFRGAKEVRGMGAREFRRLQSGKRKADASA